MLRFAVPAGCVAAVATFVSYALVFDSPFASFAEARTMATMVLLGPGLWLLTVLARPLTLWRGALIAAMGTAFILILAIPTIRHFSLDVPPPIVTLAAIGIVAVAGGVIEAGWRLSQWRAKA